MKTIMFWRDRLGCAPRRFFPSLALLVALMLLPGCDRSVRNDAKQVAQIGGETARQLADIYEVAQEDVTDTFELNQFYRAYADPNAEVALSARDKELLDIMQQTNRALASRVRLARAMGDVYESYARLADYNNAADLEKSVGELSASLNGAAAFAVPAPAASAALSQTAVDLLKATANEVGVMRQNRSLVREGKRLVPLLERLRTVFDNERKLLASEAAFPALDPQTRLPRLDGAGQPIMVMVPGIAGGRIVAYKRVFQELVNSNAVVSQPLLNRFLAQSKLVWPQPAQPFTNANLKAGVVRLIEVEAYKRGRATDTAGASVIGGIDSLIVLHRELEKGQSLSLQSALRQSALTKFWIGELKKQDVPIDSLIELIQAAKELRGGQR